MSLDRQIAEGLLPARLITGQRVAWTIEERMAHYHVPAVSVAVVEGLAIRTARAWGRLENGKPAPAEPRSPFQTASISKSVTAVGALALVREGLLDLDSDVGRYLSDWRLPRNGHQGAVTLRRLLSHSAGVSVPGFAGYADDEALPDLNQMLNGQPPANSPAVEVVDPPGQRFRYSGGGYLVVQAAMEAVAGVPFAQIMQRRVFRPLGMEDSSYAPLSPAAAEQAASGHSEAGEPIPGKGPIHAESAAGGLWSTPSDLLRLVIAIVRAYQGEEGPVLTPQLAREMLTPGFWSFGLGVRLQGEGRDLRFNHGGATRGWHGQFIAYPRRGQGVAVLTNSANGYLLWPEIERGLARALGWLGWEPQVVDPVAMSRESLEQYAGPYRLQGGLDIEVAVRPGGIDIVYDGVTWSAVPTQTDRFELLELEGQVSFCRASDGELTGFDLWFGMPDWSPYREWHVERACRDDR